MPMSDAKKRADRKYREKTYEQMNIRVHKGQREKIKGHAEKHGESLAGFIDRAITETIERDNLLTSKEL
jgi:predicted HicB family RNase H-like nuclease